MSLYKAHVLVSGTAQARYDVAYLSTVNVFYQGRHKF